MDESPVSLFHKFTEAYTKGAFLEALQGVLKHPEVKYDWLQSSEVAFPYLLNYIDSSIYKPLYTVQKTNTALQTFLEGDKRLVESHYDFLSILKMESLILSKNTFPINSPFYGPLFLQKQKVLINWEYFSRAKPLLANALVKPQELILTLPWQIFCYPLKAKPAILNKDHDLSLIFLEPLMGMDYENFLRPFAENPLIFVIPTFSHFWQLLQFENLIPFFSDPKHIIYILEFHPEKQFSQQNAPSFENKTFQSVFLIERDLLKDHLSLFCEALASGNTLWMYQIAKRILWHMDTEKYGQSRCFAVERSHIIEKWLDPYKTPLPKYVNLGKLPYSYVDRKLSDYRRKQIRRNYHPGKKIKLAHVVPQILDGGHAPSRLVRTLLSNSNKEKFDLFLISSECFCFHSLEYPFPSYVSVSSASHGVQTIADLQKQGIRLIITTPSISYEGSAGFVKELLKQYEIDAVVFHGADQINNICGSSCDVPLRVFFDHGALPHYPCYDLALLSTEETWKNNQSSLSHMGIKSYFLPFSLDVRHQWLPFSYSKKELGFPTDAFIMTTISNHLENRLSKEMCHAIGQILKKSSNTYYAPMGKIDDPLKFYVIFSQYGVSDRVIFQGARDNPSQYARSMDLYLNEFPFGSCLGMLDAMAAGCPVVSMYDENGPSQAIYAGTYFGKDRTIKTGRIEDYVELACRLISDKTFFQEWSEHAIKQYEKYANVKQYISEFESLIEYSLRSK